MALDLANSVVKYLKENSGEKYTAREIADWLFREFPDECQEKKKTSQFINTDAQLLNQIVAEISSRRPAIQKKDSKIKVTEGRPRKYYYSDKTDGAEVNDAEAENSDEKFDSDGSKVRESSLYPLLSRFLASEFSIFSKRVNEKKSSNKKGPNGNRWLYPDVVGMEDLGGEWHQEVKDCVTQHSDKRTKLWSFEVKMHINRSNVRECFFQAVSNSSWANFGYLVAAEIEGHETMKELRVLCSAHGIGCIKLLVDNPVDSEVLIPARERFEIDWATVNRLVNENRDFHSYIKLVKQFYQTGEVKAAEWEMVAE
jgi:hypothetical protein